MKSGRTVEVLLFASGLGLSLITNLFTGDDEVLNFYEANRKEVLLAGLGLTLLSVILSIKSASGGGESNESGAAKGIPLSKILSSAISSAISWILYGMLIGFITFYLVEFINQITYQTDKVLSISPSSCTAIATTIAGLISGFTFYYLDFDEFGSILVGGVIGYAASYYFPLDIPLDFLPSWLTHTPIVASAIVAGTIGLFTGIFKPRLLKAEVDSKKHRRKMREDLELLTARMKHKGYDVTATKMSDAMANEVSNMGGLELSNEQKKTVKKDMVQSNPVLTYIMNQDGAIYPPYKVFNSEGKQLYTFSSLDAFKKFSETL